MYIQKYHLSTGQLNNNKKENIMKCKTGYRKGLFIETQAIDLH